MNHLAQVQTQRHSASPVLHLEKEVNTRSKECQTPCKRETPPSITAQLPDNKKAYSNFLFFPWHLPKICLFYRCYRPSWAHFSTEGGIAVWTRAGREKSWELSWQLSMSTRSDFLGASSTTYKMLPVIVSPARTVTWVTKTTYCVLPHTILLVAKFSWNFIPNAKRRLFSGVWVIPCFTPCASSFCWCLPELQKHIQQYHAYKVILLAIY